MTTDDILYSPVKSLGDELREIIRRVVKNPTDPNVREQASDEIVDLFHRHGITDTEEMIDQVYESIADIEAEVFDLPYAMSGAPIAVTRLLFPPYVRVSAVRRFHVRCPRRA